jgi:hypothetical protein
VIDTAIVPVCPIDGDGGGRLDFALRDGPGTEVFPFQKGSPGVDKKHLPPALGATVEQETRARLPLPERE